MRNWHNTTNGPNEHGIYRVRVGVIYHFLRGTEPYFAVSVRSKVDGEMVCMSGTVNVQAPADYATGCREALAMSDRFRHAIHERKRHEQEVQVLAAAQAAEDLRRAKLRAAGLVAVARAAKDVQAVLQRYSMKGSARGN